MWDAIVSFCGATICVAVMVIWTIVEMLVWGCNNDTDESTLSDWIAGDKVWQPPVATVICAILLVNSLWAYFGVCWLGWFASTGIMLLAPFVVVLALRCFFQLRIWLCDAMEQAAMERREVEIANAQRDFVVTQDVLLFEHENMRINREDVLSLNEVKDGCGSRLGIVCKMKPGFEFWLPERYVRSFSSRSFSCDPCAEVRETEDVSSVGMDEWLRSQQKILADYERLKAIPCLKWLSGHDAAIRFLDVVERFGGSMDQNRRDKVLGLLEKWDESYFKRPMPKDDDVESTGNGEWTAREIANRRQGGARCAFVRGRLFASPFDAYREYCLRDNRPGDQQARERRELLAKVFDEASAADRSIVYCGDVRKYAQDEQNHGARSGVLIADVADLTDVRDRGMVQFLPSGMPKHGEAYLQNPFCHKEYIALDEYHKTLFRRKVAAFVRIMAAVGAKRIAVCAEKGQTTSRGSHGDTNAEFELGWKALSAEAGGRGRQDKSSNNSSAEMVRECLELKPTSKREIPADCELLLKSEPSWFAVAEQAISGSVLSQDLEVAVGSESENSSEGETAPEAAVRVLWFKLGGKGGSKSSAKSSNQRKLRCRFHVEFEKSAAQAVAEATNDAGHVKELYFARALDLVKRDGDVGKDHSELKKMAEDLKIDVESQYVLVQKARDVARGESRPVAALENQVGGPVLQQ